MADVPGRVIQVAGTVQLAGASIDRGVLSSIQAASRKTGVDFAFMLAKARRESGFQADARNATSSAQGLYQFTHQTWMEQIKTHGPEHGLGELADRITKRPGGGYQADSQETLNRVLALRHDPHVSAAMAAEYAADNRRLLSKALGRPVGGTDLYLAHFLGPGGAIDFLRALDQRPDVSAADVVPAAARANPTTFRGDDGRPRSLAEVYAVVEQGIGGAMRRFAGAAGLVAGPVPLPPGVKPAAPPLEDLSVARAAGSATTEVAGRAVPLPAGLKPAAPLPEDMGHEVAQNFVPKPLAQKPLPETLEPASPAERFLADGTPSLDEAAMLQILLAAAPLVAPEPPDTRSLGLDAVRAFGGPHVPTPAPAPAEVQWAGEGNDSDGHSVVAASVDPSSEALIAEALASLSPEEQQVIASVVEAAQAVGARRGLSVVDIAGSALRAFDALAAERRAVPRAFARLDEGAVPLSNEVQDPSEVAAMSPPSPETSPEPPPVVLAQADGAPLPEAPDSPLLRPEIVVQPDSQAYLPQTPATVAAASSSPASTTTYSILAVVESFDPGRRLTEIKGQIPGQVTAQAAPAMVEPPRDRVAQARNPEANTVVADAQAGTLLGWLRRVIS
ncbi:transglycosylase SLT domain-containing protein [Pararhodospirillum photometricum]|nr:transglycosylase SLT domain-containing protein [Pararhodospirillum photometricum]